MLTEDPSKRIICRPLVPTDTLMYQYKSLVATNAEQTPALHAEQLANKEILVLGNKEPVFEPAIQSFCLNFQGRATIASVKNFQLVNMKGDQNTNRVHLQFGKMDKVRTSGRTTRMRMSQERTHTCTTVLLLLLPLS